MIKNLIYQVAHYVPQVREQILQIVTSIDNLSTLSPAELMQFCLLEIFNHLSTNLSTNNSHYNRVIILDALDEITTLYNKRQSFLYFLSHDLIKKLPNGIRVIVTGRPEEDITMALKKWDPMIIHEDDPNHKLDLQLFIQSRLSPYVANQADRESLSTILMKKSQGKFIYLEAMTEELLSLDNLTDQEARLQILNAFPNGMSEYYYKYLTQMQQKNFAHVNPETLKRLFLIFATAKQSISKADLRILLSVHNSQLDVMMASINAFFPFSEASGLYSIYHKTLIDYLTDCIKNTCYYVDPTEGHNFLSAILLEKYRNNKSLEADNLSVTSFKYLYLYLLDHLDEGNISNQRTTFQLLTSLQWLQSSLQWKGMQLTIKDFYKRINDETWRQFYVHDRKDIQILYQFFKLIARMSHPEGSEEWRRELCIQITGRLENHEYDSYQYSIEMKQLMFCERVASSQWRILLFT